VILYAAPIWADAKKTHLRGIRSIYRLSALRVACAYRTVSDDAICVIARKVPIDLLAIEMKRLYCKTGDRPTSTTKKEERQRTIMEWQRRWEQSEKGRCTFNLIPNIALWMNRNHGEMDFYITQFFSGHGGFKAYLYRFKLEEDPFCPSCLNESEDSIHIFFYCPRFNSGREELQSVFGEPPTVANLATQMCDTVEKWNAVCDLAKQILLTLRNEERARKAERQLHNNREHRR